MIVLAPRLWSDTIAHLRLCGQARRECVAYWLGPISDPEIVDEVVHPVHRASAGSYELDRDWLHQFWVQLRRRRREVRVQVHTHATVAFHSDTDDKWPIVHTPGFYSLVIPNFATHFGSEGLFLVEIDAGGVWQQRSVRDVLSALPEEGVDR